MLILKPGAFCSKKFRALKFRTYKSTSSPIYMRFPVAISSCRNSANIGRMIEIRYAKCCWGQGLSIDLMAKPKKSFLALNSTL